MKEGIRNQESGIRNQESRGRPIKISIQSMAAAGGGGGGSTQYPNFWGSEPEEEEDYYAAHGVRGSKSFYEVPDGGPTLFTRPPPSSWPAPASPASPPTSPATDAPTASAPSSPTSTPPSSTSSPSSAPSAETTRTRTRTGTGPGRGAPLLPLRRVHGRRPLPPPPPPHPARRVGRRRPRRPDVQDLRPHPPPLAPPQILTFLARFAPTLPLVPTADLLEKSVKVPRKRLVAAANPMRYNGKPRLGTVVELLRVTDHLGARLPEVTLPFLVVHGSADEVTDPDVSRALYEAARSDDKTIRIYDSMLHSLLFGSPTTTSTSSAKTSSPG
uniref:Serine aminopeptidase S33 domain-containing protein n=1 Tax=Ananas comosus var. bracteatus TaxID=296719 RepID=A0A6V7NL74_ANACO|nr:unnamed protein product [Ananas comosus var. bracteatus]